jgi:hypothetical protein
MRIRESHQYLQLGRCRGARGARGARSRSPLHGGGAILDPLDQILVELVE